MKPVKTWTTKQPTKNGIRERLLAEGLVCGTKEWKRRYHQEWNDLNPGYNAESALKHYYANHTKIRARKSREATERRRKKREEKLEQQRHTSVAL